MILNALRAGTDSQVGLVFDITCVTDRPVLCLLSYLPTAMGAIVPKKTLKLEIMKTHVAKYGCHLPGVAMVVIVICDISPSVVDVGLSHGLWPCVSILTLPIDVL